jgi:uncharacterized protein (DUF58 family)
MRLFPTARLTRGLTLLLAASVVAAAWPPLLLPIMGGVALLLLAASLDAAALHNRPALEIGRQLPPRAVIDREASLQIRIRNPGSQDALLEVEDEWPDDLADACPRFSGLTLPARTDIELPCPLRPRKRGDRSLGSLVVFERSPLGLFRRRSIGPPDEIVSVYPDAMRLLRAASLDPRQLRSHSGRREMQRRGQGSDFESLRDYVPGDDPRHLDWRATARRGRMVTRLFQHERNHTVVLAVDTSRLMGSRCSDGRTKLDHAVDATLTLALAALGRGDQVEVMLFDQKLRGHVAPRAHRGEVGPIVELLRLAETSHVEADYQRLVRSILSRRRGRALVVLLTDIADAASAGIEAPLHLLRKYHRTLVVALRDPFYARLTLGTSQEPLDTYKSLAIDELLSDRERAMARLRRAAVQTVDLPPEDVVAPLLNRYLEFRYASR